MRLTQQRLVATSSAIELRILLVDGELGVMRVCASLPHRASRGTRPCRTTPYCGCCHIAFAGARGLKSTFGTAKIEADLTRRTGDECSPTTAHIGPTLPQIAGLEDRLTGTVVRFPFPISRIVDDKFSLLCAPTSSW
jgi:hypothetical protein